MDAECMTHEEPRDLDPYGKPLRKTPKLLNPQTLSVTHAGYHHLALWVCFPDPEIRAAAAL